MRDTSYFVIVFFCATAVDLVTPEYLIDQTKLD
jgi:hypothetical protein